MNYGLEFIENLYDFDELEKNGVKKGDIVAHACTNFDNGPAWEYCLLRDGFPKEFNTSLCAYNTPKNPSKMFPSQIGFHWCGSKPKNFRKVTESEKENFINCWIERLKKPIKDDFGWGIPEYSQILYNMAEGKLITKYKANKLNKELKEIHNVDLLKYYKDAYGGVLK